MNRDNTMNVKCSTCGVPLRISVAVSFVPVPARHCCGRTRYDEQAERELTDRCSQLQACNRELTMKRSQLEASIRQLELDLVKLSADKTANSEKAVAVKEENVADENNVEVPKQKKARGVQRQPLSTVNPNIDTKASQGSRRYNMRPR